MADMDLSFDMKDLLKLNAALSRIEKVPQRVATKAAGKGMTVIRRSVRNAAPVETGQMKRGLVRRGERSQTKGKKAYSLMFDPAKNDVFQKPIKNPGAAGGKNPKGYYPASMEYGYLTRSKGGGLSYVPGYHFMRDATQAAAPEAGKAIIQTAAAELGKEWSK